MLPQHVGQAPRQGIGAAPRSSATAASFLLLDNTFRRFSQWGYSHVPFGEESELA